MRFTFSSGIHIDLSFTGPQSGTWFDSGANRGGSIGSLVWNAELRTSAPDENAISDGKYLSVVEFDVVLNDYFSPGSNGRIPVWLSFHSPTTGWTEEFSRQNAFRIPFEILSN